MKKRIPILLLVFLMACSRGSAPVDVESKLKLAMYDHLTKGHINDTARVKYEVKTVHYFEEKTYYTCEFEVVETFHVSDSTNQTKDTTGYMSATISKDFATVTRKY